ncbi:unnamed protein product [Prorocentrum cordatum]|uniref:Uncharacterized protein n=1 Tax=Prorocentrum cordatum TaxID=2364126 RepID=A0ABN9VYW9_9DINO|nr:unnamed protein product [Polarella glacialis]
MLFLLLRSGASYKAGFPLVRRHRWCASRCRGPRPGQFHEACSHRNVSQGAERYTGAACFCWGPTPAPPDLNASSKYGALQYPKSWAMKSSAEMPQSARHPCGNDAHIVHGVSESGRLRASNTQRCEPFAYLSERDEMERDEMDEMERDEMERDEMERDEMERDEVENHRKVPTVLPQSRR